jgi:hypothetical protein
MNLKDSHGRTIQQSKWLTVGSVYEVICLTFDAYSKTMYARLFGDQAAIPAVHSIDQFEVIDSRMPPNWQIFTGKNGGLFIGPASWSTVGFWEKFFDRDASALEIFDAELVKIRAIT